MTDLGFYEKVVTPNKKSGRSAGKIAIIVIYVVAVLSSIISMFKLGFLGGFIAIVLLTLALYFLLGSSDYEYEIAINESSVTLAKIISNKRRKTVFELYEDELLFIAPATDDNNAKADGYAPVKRHEIYSDDEEGNLWMIVFEREVGAREVFVFKAEDYAIKLLKSIKPSVMKFR